MDYQQAYQYLNSFINYERKKSFPYNELRLKRVRDILKLLDNPQRNIKSIHIAGTKGKGSTAAFIANILESAGYKVGLYTSPHLYDFRERITINGRLINKTDLMHLTEKIKKVIDKYIDRTNDSPTFFEVYTILAFCYFWSKRVNFMVIETGLGGRLDATNVIRPLISVITPISHEHTDKLGSTLTKISREKAGIIKRNSIVISAIQPKAALDVIKETVYEKKVKLFVVGKDISFKLIEYKNEKQFFRIEAIFNTYEKLETSLLGNHQLINAASSIGAVEALRFRGIKIHPSAIKKGISRTRWPGRLEVLSKKPLIILDGAQNRASAKVLKIAIENIFDYHKLILILGISSDKDIKGICSVLEKISDKVIITEANHPRAASTEDIAKFISNGHPVYIRKKLKNAIRLAESKTKRDDLILIAGSLFVVAEARALISADSYAKK